VLCLALAIACPNNSKRRQVSDEKRLFLMRTPDLLIRSWGYVEGWLREEAIIASAEISPAVSLTCGSIREFRNNVKSPGSLLLAVLLSLQSVEQLNRRTSKLLYVLTGLTSNEALCKVLCHNRCVVIQSMYELGVDSDS
jgi:hypothetical protein